MDPDGEALPGGYVSTVVRTGDVVRRSPGPRAQFVHNLLRHFSERSWPGAPRFLGVDDQGREMLSHLDGVTSVDRPDLTIATDRALVRLSQLVRQFHDLTAGTALAGGAETVCHNDLDPRNTIYRSTVPRSSVPRQSADTALLDETEDLVPVAFVDWDLAAPGRRIHDVARIGWQYLGLGPDLVDLDGAARRLRLICDSYGLAPDAECELVPTMIWWQDRCWRGIESAAEQGERAMLALRESGVAAEVRAVAHWTAQNAGALASRLIPPIRPGGTS